MFQSQVLGIAASLAISCASALAVDSPSPVVRDDDHFHLDVRELANRTSDNAKVFVRADLCARAGQDERVTCQVLTSIAPIDLPGKEAGQPSNIVKYPDGNQSKPRLTGAEVNAQAKALREKVGPTASFRVITTIKVSRNGGPEVDVHRNLSQLPPLDQAGPAAEKGAIIVRDQWNSQDKAFGGRVLIVTSRKEQK